MKKLFSTILAVLALSLSFSASAQQLKLASGIKGGTYDTVLTQALAVCAPEGAFVNVQEPGGTPATLSAITANKVVGGLVQFDGLWWRSRNTDLSNIKVLMPMHTEQVHLITLAKDVKVGGFAGFGGQKIVLNAASNLKGLTVGAMGGSLVTAQAVQQLSGLGYTILSDFKDTNELLAAVQNGKIAAAFIVGGAPVPAIEKLNRTFRILPFDNATVEKIKEVYRPRSVNYENLTSESVLTVEVDAMLVVKNLESPKSKAKLIGLRDCINQNLVDLREAEGSHPAWDKVGRNKEQPRWAVYN